MKLMTMKELTMTQKIIIGLVALIVILGAIAIFSNKTYRVERVINAPPEAIWSVLMDTAAYGDWNPVFVKVVGTYREGAEVQNTFQDPSGALFDVTNAVITVSPNRELRQKGGVPGIITFDHQWLLEPTENGTRVIQHEVDRGIYIWFWDDSWIVPKYNEVLAALERQVIGTAE